MPTPTASVRERRPMARRPETITVAYDDDLFVALDTLRSIVPRDIDLPTLLRDAAIRGSEAMLEAYRSDPAAIARVIEHTTSDNPPFDRELLAENERRWGCAP